MAGSKMKVELPGNWVEILREYEASGSRPCVEVSILSDFDDRVAHPGPECLRVAQGWTTRKNLKSCSCEKSIQKEKVATIGVSQSIRKHPTPLVAISEDSSGILGISDRGANGISAVVTDKAELNYVSPGPLRDKSEPSTSSGTSLPTDCQSCGFLRKILFVSSNSTPTRQFGMHVNPPITANVHSQDSAFAGPVIPVSNASVADVSAVVQPLLTNPVRETAPAGSQNESTATNGKPQDVTANALNSLNQADDLTLKACKNESSEEFEGNGELQEPSLFIDDGTVLTSHPSGPFPPSSEVRHPGPAEREVLSSKFQQQSSETNFVKPLNSRTQCSPEPPPKTEGNVQNRPQSAGLTKPSDFVSVKIERFDVMDTKLEDFDENEPTLLENYDATDTTCRTSTRKPHAGKLMKNASKILANPVYLSCTSSEDLRDAKFQPVKNQLVMALRVENHRPKNLCPGKMARMLMDAKVERTRRWIEEIPPKRIVRSRTRLTKTPSLKWIRGVKKNGRTAIRGSKGTVTTSDICKRNRHIKTMVVRPEYRHHNRRRSGSARVRLSLSPNRVGQSSRSKHHRSRLHSLEIESESNNKQPTGILRDAQSDDRPAKRLLPGMCFMGALDKAKDKFMNKHVVSMSVHAKDAAGCPKVKNSSHKNRKHQTEENMEHHHRKRRHRAKAPLDALEKQPITMPVSQVRIVHHGHGRDVRKRESARDNSVFDDGNERFGERCKHPDCEKLRSPATLWDMLERSRAQRSEREERKGRKHARNGHHRWSSSEESVIYQNLNVVRDQAKERYIPRREENVHYGRGYLLDTVPGHRDRIHDEEPRQSQGIERWFDRDHKSHHHNHHDKPRQGTRVKRRALLQESSSSSNSSSEILVISKPNTSTHIPKPHATMDFINIKPARKRVTLSPHRPRYASDRSEPSRFHRALAKESHLRKHHAQLVRDILKLNQENGYPRANKSVNSESSGSIGSLESANYSHSHYVKSAPAKSRKEEKYQAHNRPKSMGSPSAKKARFVTRLSQRRLTSSESKSSVGYDQINVKDFVDFLVTLSRNTVGTLTNKRKAMRLYRSYLNGEYDYNRTDKGDLMSRIKKAHHRQK